MHQELENKNGVIDTISNRRHQKEENITGNELARMLMRYLNSCPDNYMTT